MTNTATITVAETKPQSAPNRSASCKDTSGAYWDFWPNKVPALAQGVTYDIEFSSRDYNGKIYRTIQKAVAKVNAASAQVNGHAAPRAANGNDSRMIFITGIVGRAMGSGQFGAAEIKLLTLAASEAWEALPK